ncbi:MAG: hypothetical protein WA159_18920 [Variovorax sp.]
MVAVLCAAGWATTGSAVEPSDCTTAAGPACYRTFEPAPSGGKLHYYASLAPDTAPSVGPTRALVAMHGHPRDAVKTFGAALLAVRRAGVLDDMLVVAPLFQVAAGQAGKCSSAGVPAAQDGDLLWTCSSWIEGGRAGNGSRVTSFAAMDALVAELARRWPSLRTVTVTVAGFLAGGQMVQHYIGFAADPPTASIGLRYVVADPGTWLYFDSFRPQSSHPAEGACPSLDRWKYGMGGLPAHLGRSAAEARQRYISADITLKLPLDMSAQDEIMALQTTGIPVDMLGNAKSGFLFVWTGGGVQSRQNIFRWFASNIR